MSQEKEIVETELKPVEKQIQERAENKRRAQIQPYRMQKQSFIRRKPRPQVQIFIPESEEKCLNNSNLQREVNQWLQNIYQKDSKFFDQYTLSKDEEDQTKQLIQKATFELSVDNNEQAIDLSMQILRIDRQNFEAYQILGQSLMKENLCVTSQFCFRLMISIVKKQCAQKQIRALTLLGACLRKNEKKDDSIVQLKKAQKLLNKHFNKNSNSMLDEELKHFPSIINNRNQLFLPDDVNVQHFPKFPFQMHQRHLYSLEMWEKNQLMDDVSISPQNYHDPKQRRIDEMLPKKNQNIE